MKGEMTYSKWMTDSAQGLFKPRSKLLKEIDKSFQDYEKAPSQPKLGKLSNAIDEWAASKEDWKESIRGDSINDLVLWVRRRQGTAVGRFAADFAPRRIMKHVDGEWSVSIQGEQTLHYPSPDYDGYCDQWFGGNHDVPFPLNVNFGIVRHGTAFVVNVRALAEFQAGASKHRPAETVLSHWKTHCESTWNCGVVYVGQQKRDLLFNLIWVKPGAPGPYYTISIHQPPPVARPVGPPPTQDERKAAAQTARQGTPNLAIWGADDKQAIAHEFGHMIGNPDEYLCTGFTGLAAAYNASIYNQPAFKTPSIMNNTAEDGGRIYERHFGMVLQEIRRFLEYTDPQPLPNIRVAIEKPAGVPSETQFVLSQAMHKRRMAMGYDD